ncbi:MBL fold metallo-hydrolase [Jiangella gansuensis]|uniref:MBL fold metallo-hydrolase n=1 Tax=Jiangella gansuensis TaxID=281473 RepID=UPI0004AD030A|nr:MBL fold metallo-hydrolase [Jiangella gansuensis]
MAGLVEVTRGVFVATHDFCTSTTTVVAADDGTCLLVDPGISPAELDTLAADLARHGLRVAAGFATHPHWDHVLWARALGDAPRFATAAAVVATAADRERGLALADEFAPGTDHDLYGRLTPLPDGAECVPWSGPRVDVVEHRAHAPGHAALHVVDAHVLITGDMCSDIEIPLLDLDAADPLGDYHHALDLFGAVADVQQVIPGHGHVGDGAELRRRLTADRHYLDEISAGRGDDDPRLTQAWLVRDHRAQRAKISITRTG